MKLVNPHSASATVRQAADELLLVLLRDLEEYGGRNGRPDWPMMDVVGFRQYGIPYRPSVWFDECSPAERMLCSRAARYLEETRRMERITNGGRDRVRFVIFTTRGFKQALTLTLASRQYRAISAQSVEWLWQNRIALGKLSLLVGQPGLGKTFIACDMAARVSQGEAFPDGSMPPIGEAAILTAEDGAGDTLRPRLDAAGADVSRVHHIDGIRSSDGKPHFLSLASHLPAIEEWLNAHPEVRLFVVDPISAFMGDGDSHKNAEVRAVLGPLADLAERHRLAVLGITHLSKGQAKTINRIIGSIAFVAAARAAWLIGEDPDTPERRLFLPVKNNLGKAGGLAYRLAGDEQATRIEWDSEPVLISADDIDDDGERTPLEEAKAWLDAQLTDKPVPSASVLKKAKADGIAERTLKRAKAELGIVSEREGKAWVWRLPEMTSLETDDDAFIVE